jgi:fused signal recognition particle receptor
MFGFLKRSPKTAQPENSPQEEKPALFSHLVRGLKRTRAVLLQDVTTLFSKSNKIDAALLQKLEEQLIMADVGVAVASQVMAQLKLELKKTKEVTPEIVLAVLQQQLENILLPCTQPLAISEQAHPFVILLVGVNGSGKTTTIGKLAKQLQGAGKKVMLAAGDTFRAAAIEQLKVWGERNLVTVIAQQSGSDSAAVLFDAMQAAKARDVDVLIADTAGRLHTQHNLMSELQKIKRTIQKIDPSAPHEVLLVLDATTGQNALTQAKQFRDAIGVSGICITKLDGTARGGIIFAIAQTLQLPIRFIGVGEGIEDLRSFEAKEFVAALFNNTSTS